MLPIFINYTSTLKIVASDLLRCFKHYKTSHLKQFVNLFFVGVYGAPDL